MNPFDAIPTAPGAWPLLGHLPALRDPLAFLSSLSGHGEVVRVRIGPATAVVVCDPRLTQQVVRDDRTFDRGGYFFDRLREWWGDGLATCMRSSHRRQRRLCQPAFHPSRQPDYAQVFISQATAATDSWRDGQELDILAEATAVTARSLLASMFSNALPEPVLLQALGDFGITLGGIFRRMLTPPPLDRLPIPANRRYHEADARLRRTLTDVIAERRAGLAHHGDHGDLLSALLAAQDPEGSGDALSDSEIVDQVLTFFAAGTDTTAVVLSWSLHLIAQHPDIERQLHEEVDDVIGERPLTFDDLARLDLTRRVVAETLRMYPPGWQLTRRVTADTQLGGYALPAGATVVYSPYLIHRRADCYPEPDRFDPDRWLPDRATTVPRDAYIPFGGGARKCIGDTFALNEASLNLAAITRRWCLQPVPGQRVRPAPATALRPSAVRMRVTARSAG